MTHAYYNEIDPLAAAWLRELIREGLIADGTVDERDIRDVAPDELAGFAQCHFFAGIGVWSYALRSAGWPDDREVWTGSCPCQPFSAAGKRGGTDDERHLWPSWFHLIEQRRPAVVFGEQVASADGLGWLDLVQADLEGADYAAGAVDLCAAGVGAPHIRQRLWFVAESLVYPIGSGLEGLAGHGDGAAGRTVADRPAPPSSPAGIVGRPESGRRRELGDASQPGRSGHADSAGGASGGLADADGGHAGAERQQRGGEQRQQPQDGGAGGLAEPRSIGRVGRQGIPSRRVDDGQDAGRLQSHNGLVGLGQAGDARSAAGPVNGLWRDADWLFCRDGKWRPVEPGTFPLAHGAPARVGRLRGYGNAINAAAAQAFIQAYLEARS